MRSFDRCAIVLSLACALGGGCTRLATSSPPAELPDSGVSRIERALWPGPPRPQPQSDADRVYYAKFYAWELAKTDPDAAIADLESALGRWPDYDAEFHFGIAMAVDRKIFRSPQTSSERIVLFQQKLEHLEKALSCINGGGRWISDQMETRTRNLELSIEQARLMIKRLSQ